MWFPPIVSLAPAGFFFYDRTFYTLAVCALPVSFSHHFVTPQYLDACLFWYFNISKSFNVVISVALMCQGTNRLFTITTRLFMWWHDSILIFFGLVNFSSFWYFCVCVCVWLWLDNKWRNCQIGYHSLSSEWLNIEVNSCSSLSCFFVAPQRLSKYAVSTLFIVTAVNLLSQNSFCFVWAFRLQLKWAMSRFCKTDFNFHCVIPWPFFCSTLNPIPSQILPSYFFLHCFASF